MNSAVLETLNKCDGPLYQVQGNICLQYATLKVKNYQFTLLLFEFFYDNVGIDRNIGVNKYLLPSQG